MRERVSSRSRALRPARCIRRGDASQRRDTRMSADSARYLCRCSRWWRCPPLRASESADARRENSVRERCRRTEHAEIVQEADRRPAVAAHDLVELLRRLPEMCLKRNAALARRSVSLLDEFGRAGVDLRGHHDAANAPGGMARGRIAHFKSGSEAALARGFIPDVLDRVIARRVPRRGTKHRERNARTPVPA